MDSYVDEKLGPWVGVGLVFLLSRQLMYGSKIRTGELLLDLGPIFNQCPRCSLYGHNYRHYSRSNIL